MTDRGEQAMVGSGLGEEDARASGGHRSTTNEGSSIEAQSDGEDLVGLTERQLLVWVQDTLDPDVPSNNMLMTFEISGDLDPERFKTAFQATIDHTDTMRMVIEVVGGLPRQRVRPAYRYDMQYLDFSSEADPRRKLEKWVDARGAVLFDLSERSFESTLIKVDEGVHVWFLCQHHIFTDAMSFSLVFRKLEALYAAPAADLPAESSFLDYVAHERAYRDSDKCQDDERFWKQRLALPTEPLELYGKRREHASARVRRIIRPLGREGTETLKAIANAPENRAVTPDVSLFVALMTVLFAYVHRATGNARLAIGAPVVVRRSKQLRETIGLLMEMGIYTVTVAEDETFLSLLQKVRQEAYDVLQRSQHCIKNSAQDKAYDVSLNLQSGVYSSFNDLPLKATVATGLHALARCEDAKFDRHWGGGESLTLQVQDFSDTGSLDLLLDFNCGVFDEAQSARATQHVMTVMESFLEDPRRPLHRVNLVTEDERRLLRDEINDTAATRDSDGTLVDLFATRVETCAERQAVSFRGETLTYGELGARANRLAHRLRKLGVERNTLVAVFMDRSLEMLVAMLAVLRSGGAYVPLDPSHPVERNSLVLEDAEPLVVLTQDHLQDRLPGPGSARVLVPDDDAGAPVPDDDLAVDVDPADLAYVIFTSGSTGRPKGVQIPHGALANFLLAMQNELDFASDDRLLAVTTVSFDIAGLELFLPLVAGGSLEIADQETCVDAMKLSSVLERRETTVMQATPATWRMLCEAGWRGVDGFKIVCGGEELPRALADQLLGGAARVWNVYGPTETTIWSTIHELSAGTGTVPIGRPLWNTQVHVLDAQLEPTPLGVPGELYIGGAGLAIGYHQRPELTAERFVQSPFGGEPGARMYRTGDRARILPTGDLEWLGRVDTQIKVRGFRIEPGEIEAVLREDPAVKETVVIAHDVTDGDRMLVAYLVGEHGASPDIARLLALLRDRLPRYMIPASFVPLASLPLTANGKVDRKQLPAPGKAHGLPAGSADRQQPRDEIERTLVGFWTELLQLERVGVDDDFFDVGGHSLLALRLFGRIRQTWNLDWTPSVIFEAPTIEGCARMIRDATGTATTPSTTTQQAATERFRYVVPMAGQDTRATPLFVVAGAGGHVLSFQQLAQIVAADRPFYGIQARGVHGDEAPRETIEEMAADYLAEVRAVQPEGPYMLGGFCSGGIIALEMAQRLLAAGERVSLLVFLDTIAPLHLRKQTISRALKIHWHRLKRDGPGYLFRGFGNRLRWEFKRLHRRFRKQPTAAASLESRTDSVFDATMTAQDHYYPRPYPGKVGLFRTQLEEHPALGAGREGRQHTGQARKDFVGGDLGWNPYVRNMEICECPVKPEDHDELLLEPAVRALGTRLRQQMEHL